jgi:predicted N-acetyltransferase YhbS
MLTANGFKTGRGDEGIGKSATTLTGCAERCGGRSFPSLRHLVFPMPISDYAFLNEEPAHEPAIQLINEEAFGPGRFVRAAERVREQGLHDPSLSFVATDGAELVASVRMTPIIAGLAKGHLLGPLAVRPNHKNLGIGRELVRIALAAAEAAGSEAVVLVGDPPPAQRSSFRDRSIPAACSPCLSPRARWTASPARCGTARAVRNRPRSCDFQGLRAWRP